MNSRVQEVFFESEAALRLVDHEIDELRGVTHAEQRLAGVSVIDACERASDLVDALDAIDRVEFPDRAQASALRASLREELDHMMSALQSRELASIKSSVA